MAVIARSQNPYLHLYFNPNPPSVTVCIFPFGAHTNIAWPFSLEGYTNPSLGSCMRPAYHKVSMCMANQSSFSEMNLPNCQILSKCSQYRFQAF